MSANISDAQDFYFENKGGQRPLTLKIMEKNISTNPISASNDFKRGRRLTLLYHYLCYWLASCSNTPTVWRGFTWETQKAVKGDLTPELTVNFYFLSYLNVPLVVLGITYVIRKCRHPCPVCFHVPNTSYSNNNKMNNNDGDHIILFHICASLMDSIMVKPF